MDKLILLIFPENKNFSGNLPKVVDIKLTVLSDNAFETTGLSTLASVIR